MVTSNKFTSGDDYEPDIFIQADYVVQQEAGATAPPALPTETPTGTPSSVSCTTIHHPPNRIALKNRRKKRKVVAGVIGGTVGLLTLGPFGAIGIGIASALAVKHADRARERKLLQRYEIGAATAAQAGAAMNSSPTSPIYSAVHA